MIDEIPIFTVACVFAKGKTIITGAKELRYKESDRIKAMATELSKLGADIIQTEDGFIIEGIKKERLKGKVYLSSYDDHRIAMSLIIASLKSQKENYLDNIDCIEISDPNFMQILNKLCK
jgi:3-phosphoshikimate 1-carboxyvinyltransferase